MTVPSTNYTQLVSSAYNLTLKNPLYHGELHIHPIHGYQPSKTKAKPKVMEDSEATLKRTLGVK